MQPASSSWCWTQSESWSRATWKELFSLSSASAAGKPHEKTQWAFCCVASLSAALWLLVVGLFLWETRGGDIWHFHVAGKFFCGVGCNKRVGDGKKIQKYCPRKMSISYSYFCSKWKHRKSVISLPKDDGLGSHRQFCQRSLLRCEVVKPPKSSLNKLVYSSGKSFHLKIHSQFYRKFSTS